jgi:hypothetical protein
MVTREAINRPGNNCRRGRAGQREAPVIFGGLGLAALGVKVDDAKATKTTGSKPAKAK